MIEDIIEQQLAALRPLREIDVPDFRGLVEDDPMALTLVVDTSHKEDSAPASEQEVLTAAAQAVALAMTNENPDVQAAVQQWCRGRIRKLVKRAKASAWEKLFHIEDYVATSFYNEASVSVFRPQPISQMAPELRKLQVQGLQFERDASAIVPLRSHLQIQLDENLSMSTGKAAAQVGHSAQLFLMRAPESQVRTWLSTGMPVVIDYVQQVVAEYEIRDAGFTEVAPNSLTSGSSFIL